MKTLAPLSLTLFLSAQCVAQTSLFDGGTGVLDIPCVALYYDGAPVLEAGGAVTTYEAQLTQVTGRFRLDSAEPVTAADECHGRYDAATGVYTDLVSLADDAWQISMSLGGGTFSLDSYAITGPAKTSLWVISNGANTVYLGGVTSALRPSDYPLPRAFDEAYAKSSTLYFEIDYDDPVESGANLTLAQQIALNKDREGKTLNQVLSPATYSALAAYLATRNVAIADAAQWAVQTLLAVVAEDDVKEQAGVTASGSLAFFVDKAKSDAKPIFGLDTAASARAIQQSVNEGLEDALVLSTLEKLDSGEAAEELLLQLDAWRRGDVATIQQTYAEVRTENRKDYDLIQTNRNLAWLPKIQTLLNSSETELVLVSTANITGPEGLLALLKARGYTVKKY